MGFLDGLKRLLGGGAGGGRSDEGEVYRIYAQCRRCGEPLQGRVNLRNEPSLDDDGETWIVRKGLIGSGARRCFQTVEVTLKFDASRKKLLESQAVGGKLITEAEYEALIKE